MASRVARPNTLVIQCPDQVASMSEHDFMVELFKSIPKSVMRTCQFLLKNYVRVTFKDEASHDLALIKGVSVRGFQLNVFEADPKAALVYCYWVPVEVSTDLIRHALSAYGQVLECQRQVHPAFQDIESGVWIVRVKLSSQIPEGIRILNFPCKIYYRGQPKSCRSCKKTGHQAKDCLFKDKCFRCGSADHQARNYNPTPMPGMFLWLLPLLALMPLSHLVLILQFHLAPILQLHLALILQLHLAPILQLHLAHILLLHLADILLHHLLLNLLVLICILVLLRKLPLVSPLMFRLFLLLHPRSRCRLSSPLLPLRRTLWLLALHWFRIQRSCHLACLLWRIFRLVPSIRRVFWFTVLLSLIPFSRTRVFCLLMLPLMPLVLV